MNARVAAIISLAATLSASAELAVRSPFEVAQVSPADVVRRDELELRGIMQSADGTRYCIFDRLNNSGIWAAVAEPSGKFVIRSADPAAEEVTLENGGRIVTLRLRESKVTPQTPDGNAPLHAIVYQPLGRRQPGEPRAPKTAGE